MQICLFDIDGTLLNTGGAGQAAMEDALKSEFDAERPVEGISTAGRTDRAIVKDLFDYHSVPVNDLAFGRFLAAYLRHLPVSLADLDGGVLPGIALLLELLVQRDDVLLGLLTGNFRDGANLKLKHYGLDGYFKFGGFGDDHHHRDDVARAAMEEVEQRMGGSVGRKDVWVIGDTPADVQCGRAINANVVAVGTGLFAIEDLEAAEPDHLVENFADPHTLLSLLP